MAFGDAGPERAHAAPEAQIELTVHAVRRCSGCGWIESKRELAPGVASAGAPRIYEYTLRMADGSSSVFEEALPTSWRLGERLRVLEGWDSSPD